MSKHVVILGVIGLLLSACTSNGGDSTNNSDSSNNSDNGGVTVGGNGNTVVLEAPDATDSDPSSRNLIEELQARVDGFFILVPYINGVRPRNVQGEGFEWTIQNIQSIETIDFSDIDAYLTATSNDILLELIFQQRQGFADLIAVASFVGVPSSNNGGTIASDNLLWRYEDFDQDGLFDVQELGVSPVDCDGDVLAPFEDSDSDNDGIIDSQDSTPHGPPCV